MPLPQDFIDRLKAANPIEEVMGSYITLKRTGRDYICLCPFHNEKTPSCHIHPDKEFFHCFGCGAGGDVITFVMKYHNLDYWEAVKMLAERGNIPLPETSGFAQHSSVDKKRFYEMNKDAAKFFYSQLKTDAGKACIDYLVRKRKLSFETIKKYGMGFAPNSWSALKTHMLSLGYTEQELIDASLISRSQKTGNTFDFFVNRAMFPFIDLTGHIIGFGGRALSSDDKRKYLNSHDTIGYNKNKFLFSMNFAKNSCVKTKEIILCEGNLDVISLNQAGFENAVASCGTALTPEQARLISNYADKVIICYDSDEAGQKATKRAIPILTQAGLKPSVIKVTGAKDPDEFIQKYGAVSFQNLLLHADGAVNYNLNNSKQGLDLNVETDKIEYLNRAYTVIAELRSPVEREIYISKLANEQGVSVQSITNEVNSIIRAKKKQREKKHLNDLITFADRKRDPLNPDAYLYPKEVMAEQGLIYFIFNNPDKAKEFVELLPPQSFVTELNARIYKSLTDKILCGESYDISTFNGEFSPDEMGKITEILSSGFELGITEEVALDYIAVINRANSKKREEELDINSDEDFLEMLKRRTKT